MRSALTGDRNAYRKFLISVTPYLRAVAHRGCERSSISTGDAEDIVQEVLLLIHLKRDTWDTSRAIGPWLAAIVRNKLVDVLRRRGGRVEVPIEEVIETLGADARTEIHVDQDVERLLGKLKEKQRDIVLAISVDGYTARETASRLNMSEGTVRVTLHRALKQLAALYRSDVR